MLLRARAASRWTIIGDALSRSMRGRRILREEVKTLGALLPPLRRVAALLQPTEGVSLHHDCTV